MQHTRAPLKYCILLYCKDAGSGKPSALESLAKLQLKNFVTVVNVQSDSSLTVRVNLGSCELDDTRPSRVTGITRYFTAGSVASFSGRHFDS